jgi:hypothetical protein
MATQTTPMTRSCGVCETARAHMNALMHELIASETISLEADGKDVHDLAVKCDDCKSTGIVLTDAGKEFLATIKVQQPELVDQAEQALGVVSDEIPSLRPAKKERAK